MHAFNAPNGPLREKEEEVEVEGDDDDDDNGASSIGTANILFSCQLQVPTH